MTGSAGAAGGTLDGPSKRLKGEIGAVFALQPNCHRGGQLRVRHELVHPSDLSSK
jgi:hypothetical protein